MRCFVSKDIELMTDGPATSSLRLIIPESLDYIIVFSTLYGCVSFRHPENGSIFIVKLCQYLRKCAMQYDFETILKFVRDDMKDWNNESDKEGEYSTQICPEESTLTAYVYFDIL